MSLPLLILILALGADPIDAEKASQVEHDLDKAQAEVSARYGNKKFTELTPEERKQMEKDRADAEKKVLDKAGVDIKTWARESLKKSRAQYADNKARLKTLADKDKADAEAAEKAKQASTEVRVQKGFSDENPVVLEEQQGAEPVIEKGTDAELAADQAAAAEQDRLEGNAFGEGNKAPATPTKAARGKGGRGR